MKVINNEERQRFEIDLPDGSVAFASELKGLLRNPLLRQEANLTAIEDFLAFGYVPDDNCIVAGVEKLPAGHFLMLERGKPVPAPTRWWTGSAPCSRPSPTTSCRR